MNKPFVKGLYHGLPIALGYLCVSFGFGIVAAKAGLNALAAVGISASNLTSAGQAAGVGIIAAGGSLLEMALTQLVINMRYSLMGVSLSQKLDASFNTPRRLVVSFGITDEIFAVASAQKGLLSARYMYGLILISFLGWTTGTYIGASAGNVLPQSLSDAMGISLYSMFAAVVIPAAKREKSVLLACVLACCFSIVFKYAFVGVSGGFAVIISAVVSAGIASAVFPVPEEESSEREEGRETMR